MVASSYLAYGGNMLVVRADDTHLKNATDNGQPEIKIKSDEHYTQLGYDESTISNTVVAAQNPGSWANGIRVAIIDAKADQTLTLNVAGAGNTVGYGITQTMKGKKIESPAGSGTIVDADGYLEGIITGVKTDNQDPSGTDYTTIDVKVLKHVTRAGTSSIVEYTPGGEYSFDNSGETGIKPNNAEPAFTVTTSAKKDWYEQQVVGLTTGLTPIEWDQVADRP